MATADPQTDRPRDDRHRPIPLRERLLGWKEILETANPPAHRPLDTVGKWLVITRAAVFPMTIWSGLIGGLLAAEAARVHGGAAVDWPLFLLAVVGLVLAHAANNMINDYFDTTGGIDTDDYVRALYAPHPILSGWVTKASAQRGDPDRSTRSTRAIMLFLAYVRGPLDPRLRPGRAVRLRLLRRPADPAQVPRPRRARRVPRLGPVHGRRHVPRCDRDDRAVGPASPRCRMRSSSRRSCSASTSTRSRPTRKLGVRTLPVILGEARARVVGELADDPLLSAEPAARPRRLGRPVDPPRRPRHTALAQRPQGLPEPKPLAPPPGYPERGWPLWFVGYAFIHTRRAGGLFTLGLVLNVLLPITLPLPWL